MLFVTFLKSLVQDCLEAKHLSVLESEAHRKSHYEKNDEGHLAHKTTSRKHGDKVHEIPEKTVHAMHDFLLSDIKLKTKVNVYKSFAKLRTHVKDGLFSRGALVEIELTLSREEAPEGVHAQVDSLNDKIKENLDG